MARFWCDSLSMTESGERAHTHTFKSLPPCVVSVALCFFIVYVGLRCAFNFPQIGFCLRWLQNGSVGVGGEASSHVAQSVVYVICLLVPFMHWISHK
jgi:hypothetical protein